MIRVDHEKLQNLNQALLSSVGVSEEDARKVSESLVKSDIRGHQSHGSIRVPFYTDMINGGGLDPEGTPSVIRETDVSGNIDGQSTFGQIVGRVACDIGLDKAKDNGFSIIGIKQATHLGRIGEWAETAVEEEFIFLGFVNSGGGGRSVGLPGVGERVLATNPISIGCPTFDALDFPLIMDIATSQVAAGKIRERLKSDEPIPEGWAIDEDNTPMTDPAEFFPDFSSTDGTGAIKPLGGEVSGYKGSNLSIMTELLSGLIGNAPVQGETSPEWFSNGAAFMFIDPSIFLERSELSAKIKMLAEHIRDMSAGSTVGPAAFGDEYLLPGEAEHQQKVRNLEDGIPLHAGTIEALNEMAADHSIDPSLTL
jgi:uncharacterized oxidoreductase